MFVILPAFHALLIGSLDSPGALRELADRLAAEAASSRDA